METLPRFFDERAHNLEIYAQKQIFNRMTILNELPMNQNVAGEFTIVFLTTLAPHFYKIRPI